MTSIQMLIAIGFSQPNRSTFSDDSAVYSTPLLLILTSLVYVFSPIPPLHFHSSASCCFLLHLILVLLLLVLLALLAFISLVLLVFFFVFLCWFLFF